PEKLKRGRRWKQAAVPVRPITAPRWPKSVLISAVLGFAVALANSVSPFFHRASLMGTPRASETSAPVADRSIAVMPFENLSDEKQNAYFADGVQDEILTGLARVADLKVISRTSVMQYKSGVMRNLRKVAKELGVAHVLGGSVQRTGGRVRGGGQWTDARTGRRTGGESC